MYSERIVNKVLDGFAAKHGWRPVAHTEDEVTEFIEYVNSLLDISSNSTRTFFDIKDGLRLTQARRDWIRQRVKNEQAMCFASAEYFASRYAHILVEEEVIKFSYRDAQRVFHSILAQFDDIQIAIQLFVLKCLHPATRVLTADLRWVAIGNLKVGDELVAVDEKSTPEQDYGRNAERWKARSNGTFKPKQRHEWSKERKMRTCKVEARWEKYDECVRITFEDGRTITSGLEHPFLGRSRTVGNVEWRKAGELKVGDHVRWVTQTWGEANFEDGWFGGFTDGEGHLGTKRAGVEVNVAQRENVALERARIYLRSRGYTFGEEWDTRKNGETSKFGNDPVAKLRVSRMDELFRLIGQTRPSRFIDQRWWEGRSMPGKKSGIGWGKVVSVELLPRQRLVDIQTSTGTFIAEGFVSHNCRQLGVSTVVALYFLHRILFRINTRAYMASVKQEQSDKLAKMLDICWSKLPFWLVPPKTVLKTNEPEWSNGSSLSVQSGSKSVGIAQGATPSCIHISELGDIPAPKKTLEEGLFPACHPHRNMFFVMEGTGSGDTGWQADKWRYYKANWGKGGRFRTIFIPPACAKDLYPLPDWIRGNPIPEGWRPIEATERMRRKSELFIRSTDYLANVMGPNWKMGREYMYFWETRWLEAVATHTEKVWLSQMACTDDEALQGKFDPAMNSDVIEVITKEREKAYIAYAITGKTILMGSENEPYQPPEYEIDYDMPRIPVRWDGPDGNHYDWELVPLKPTDDSADSNLFDKLLIFQEPKVNVDYSLGVDCADGLGNPNEDRACASGWINRYGKERDEQVCSFTTVRCNSPQMSRIVACIAALYGKETKSEMGMRMAIEQRRKPGDECQHQLKIMGFINHHRMVMYDNKGMPDPSKATKEGFFTNVWSRPMMLNKFLDAINTGWAKPNCPILIRQLQKIVRKETSGISKIDHETGEHDDNVFGGGMAYFTAHDLDNTALRQEQRYRSDQDKNQVVNTDWCTQEVTV